MQQGPEITLEITGARARIVVRCGDATWCVGDDMSGRYGFEDCRLSKRLVAIIVALAVHRKRSNEDWLPSDRLAELAGCGATGAAIAQFLQRRLRDEAPCANHGVVTEPRLIEFWSRGSPGRGARGGRSRGPYRLGVCVKTIRLDEDTCRAILEGPVSAEEHVSRLEDCEPLLLEASLLATAGHFEEGMDVAARAFYLARRHGRELSGRAERDNRLLGARAIETQANMLMELGRWAEGLDLTRRALGLYEALHHPEGVAHCLQIEAHLWGQSNLQDGNERGLWAARRSLLYLDNSAGDGRKGLRRAVFSGVVGLRMSKVGAHRKAEKRLLAAHRTCLEHGSPRWAAVWAVRLSQNAIGMERLGAAEQYLDTATGLEGELTLAGRALLLRARAEFCVESGQWGDAERLIAAAYDVGRSCHMENQLRRVRELELRHELRRRTVPR